MQIKKENIRQKILEVASEEFLKLGYKDTSMRKVALKSKTNLSNLYNYFQSKDEILNEVLNPLLKYLEKMLEEHNKAENLDIRIFTSEEYQKYQLTIFLELVIKYQKELNLLFHRSQGSSLENYKNEICNRHTVLGIEYIHKMKTKYPYINTNISDFFLHTISSWWISLLGELVSHELSDDEMKKFMQDYMLFATAGWKRIMGV